MAVAAFLSLAVGCSRPRVASTEQIRKTPDGGTIVVSAGSKSREATRTAVSAMESHCQGEYAVVEISKTSTGTAYSYACRKPGPRDLNQGLIVELYAGLPCSAEKDCGGAPCVQFEKGEPDKVCARMDGSLPFVGPGGDCSKTPCMPGYACARTATKNFCTKN
jgi:hypothetical protein